MSHFEKDFLQAYTDRTALLEKAFDKIGLSSTETPGCLEAIAINLNEMRQTLARICDALEDIKELKQ
jgi:hypothetical protein